MEKLKVIVFSDYVCPFCFIAKNLVDRLSKEFDIDVEWKAFQIHPETPPQGMSFDELGSDNNRIQLAYMHASELASELGIEMNFPHRMSGSRLALEIGQFAREKGKFQEFHDAAFQAYWQDGEDIGNEAFLLGIVKKVGLEPVEVREYISSAKADDFLEQNALEAMELGVGGIPTIFIGDILRVDGVQPYEFLSRAVEKALAMQGNEVQ